MLFLLTSVSSGRIADRSRMVGRRNCSGLLLFWYFVLFVVLVGGVSCFYDKYCQIPCDFVETAVPHTVCTRAEQKCGPDPKCGPDFEVVSLSDADRQYILDIHNYLRNKVALGYEKRGEQPSASNMNIMNYNPELEFIAQCWANACNGEPLVHDLCRRTHAYQHVGQNLGYINSSSPEIDIVASIKELTLAWYDEVKDYDKSWVNDTEQRDVQVGHYTQLVWADSSEIGCAISYYTTESWGRKWHHIIYACNYGPGGNYLTRPVYKTGKPCSKCSKGKSNKKYRGLCGNVKPLNEVKKKSIFH